MLSIAICEDEKIVLEFECALVKRWAGEMNVPFRLDSYVSAEQFLFQSEDKADYDILIFDIQMKNMNGMELAKTLRKRGCNSSLIFVTGVKDYAIEGYEVGAVRYLLKPVKEEVLFGLLDSIYKEIEGKADEYFVLGQGADVCKIPYSKIIYLESRAHYIFLKATDFTKEWKANFSDVSASFNQSFFCLRRGLLVNLNHVARITRTECILDNNETLPVARSCYKALNEAFIKMYIG